MTEELLLCQCSDPEHQLIMFYDDDIEAPAVYVSIHLSPERNFFKRLWNGLKYIFRMQFRHQLRYFPHPHGIPQGCI